ncbi:magnesium/cobalt transporter CorA [Spirosoma utsteinense]|uniref:Magnesium transport protein CorA n=1 Tax=Spirosoma utsteinense TaxID=2585773 RepID=A0ABR6WE85_9BACT|nr:magnesium/cobalt transporter CorA [Spirosoma utsteinense]MBC3785667.1 magnesium transporter [Spirosoma utsteinense]MBC3794599.1 magnesium transporter [Spirosoma utsteinense]
MSKHRRFRSAEKNFGTSPGTLTYIGEEIEHAIKIKRIEYNATDYRVDDSSKLSACRLPSDKTPYVNWLNVDGIHDPKVVSALGQQYRLHPLLLEDVMNTEQKPKIDLYDDTPILPDASANGHSLPDGQPAEGMVSDTVMFVTLKMLHHSRQRQEIDIEHISLVLGKNYLISFQEERTKDIFEPVIERIKASAGKTRRNGADYLMYALMDVIVDHYFVITDHIGDKMEEVEDQIVQQRASQETLSTLYVLKRELALIRRTVYPLRDVVGTLLREESDLVRKSTLPYLHDLADHVSQIIETLDSHRELIAGLMDVYYSIVSNRMNSVMKTLTIVSAIFIPLTFIAGIYGMNFDNMPELRTRTGYFWALGIMAAIAIGEIIYFKRRGWM